MKRCSDKRALTKKKPKSRTGFLCKVLARPKRSYCDKDMTPRCLRVAKEYEREMLRLPRPAGSGGSST